MNNDLRGYFVKVKDELDDAAYKKDNEKMKEIFERNYKGDKAVNLYMIGWHSSTSSLTQ